MPDKNTLRLKQRMAIPRAHMPELDSTLRSRNFEEVNRGLPPADALLESSRCIECAKPGCVEECPVGVKVKEVVALVYAGDYLGAAAKLREDNALPAITGRVCPQENQCEGGCVLGRKGAPLAIGHLERFVADYERASGRLGLPHVATSTGKSIAIVGSGPAGLSAAGDLIQKGHRVHVFEALHELGGVLVYGIPEFRLPKSIVREGIDNLRSMGVEFEINVVVGKSVTIDELMRDESYDAVFVATGAGLPRFLGIPGEHLNGVYSANEFLTRVNLMRAYRALEYDEPVYDCQDRDVMVVGGGNTAMDAVRTARRLGARTASLVYRRSEAEMPARGEEVKHAREEGIEFRVLTDPVAFLGDDKGWLTGARCMRMELGAPDASGRRSPVPIKGSEFVLPVNVAIIGVGTTANPLIQSTTPDLATNSRNYIVADPGTMRTSKRGVFAGGDIVTGAATVILAMGAGRKAAASIHQFLTTERW
ncbi:MAG TPA: NADPH-dependent glutamate synthase [Terracidiphilus sp.]|jgi:glutamate synthase (NADPH/NADH) small chain